MEQFNPQLDSEEAGNAIANDPEHGPENSPENGPANHSANHSENKTENKAENNPTAQAAQPGAAESETLEPGTLEATRAAQDSEQVSGFFPVLKNTNFLALWSGQVFSQIADKVYLVLMIALISRRFQSPDQSISGWVSAIMIAFTIPAILFGSVAGIFVGRTAKQPVLVLTNLLRGALVLALPFLLGWVGSAIAWGGLPLGFYLLLLITFLVSTLTQFFAPAEQAVLPLIVENRLLLSANSLYTTTMMAAAIVGFAIGEQVLDWADGWVKQVLGFSSGNSLAVGISYVLAGSLILLMQVHEPQESTAEETHLWADIQDGLAYLRDNRLVRGALIRLVVLFSVFAALAVLAVRVAEVIPTLDTDQFGLLLSAGSLGLGLGAVLVGQFGQRFPRARLGIGATLGMAASLVVLSVFTTQFWFAIASIALFGFFSALLGIPAQTTIQEQTPPQMRGKIFGLQNNAVNIALSLPLALAGITEQFIGLRLTLLGLAVLIILGNLSTWYLSRPQSSSTDGHNLGSQEGQE